MISIIYYPKEKNQKTTVLRNKYFWQYYYNNGNLNIVAWNILKNGGFVSVHDYQCDGVHRYGLILENGKLKKITANECEKLKMLYSWYYMI